MLRFTSVLLNLRRGAALNGRLRSVGRKLQLVGMVGNDFTSPRVNSQDRSVINKRLLYFCGHDAPLADKLAEQRFLSHAVKVLVPERGVLPHILVGDLAVLNLVVGLLAERLRICIRMVENLFTRPVDALPETIQVFEVRHVANDRKPFTQIVVLNEPESRLCRFGIFPQIFALPNLHAAQFPILAAAERKLDISLVTKDKLCLEALGRKQIAAQTTVLTMDGETRVFAGEAQGFAYRTSAFENLPVIIVKTVFQLAPGGKEEISARMQELMDKRRTSQPLELPSAGSTFKRPEGAYAGALIQGANIKGISVGGACVSEKHAGFIVNAGGATARDVKVLIELVQKRVFETSGYCLQPEVRIW